MEEEKLTPESAEDKFKREDAFSESMLIEIAESGPNAPIKVALMEAAQRVDARVFMPLRAALEEAQFNIDALSPGYKKAMEYLIKEHSSVQKQWGGVARDMTDREIKSDPAKVAWFMDAVQTNLSHIAHADTIDTVAASIKIITDGGFCYVDCFSNAEKFGAEDPIKEEKNYAFVDAVIRPSQAELDARLMRSTPMYATKFGLGENDLVQRAAISEEQYTQQRDSVRVAGKSVFGGVSSEAFAEKLITQYQNASPEEKINIKTGKKPDTLGILRMCDVVAEYDLNPTADLERQMAQYGIPLDPHERNPLHTYVKASSIERLAEQSGFPLVASASGTMGRALVTLQHFGAFNDAEGVFDPGKAQMLSNAIGMCVHHGGHHSMMEVGETYNRLLDCAAVQAAERGEYAFAQEIVESSQWRVVGIKHSAKSLQSFIHPSYRDAVSERAEALQHGALERHAVETLPDAKRDMIPEEEQHAAFGNTPPASPSHAGTSFFGQPSAPPAPPITPEEVAEEKGELQPPTPPSPPEHKQ